MDMAPPDCHAVSQSQVFCGLHHAFRSTYRSGQSTPDSGRRPGGKMHSLSHNYLRTADLRKQGHFLATHPHQLSSKVDISLALRQVVESQQTWFVQIGDVHRQPLHSAAHADTNIHWALELHTVPRYATQPLWRVWDSSGGQHVRPHQSSQPRCPLSGGMGSHPLSPPPASRWFSGGI
ncbi:uncharacterized protein LOC135094787 isoform X2 [Scylla paramamosain]|uniref:uncharacterized protein LOC135094787 isoform X2 n=1 Tax=Scylla paramamosain TaxID=85552 RepID=UPI003083A52D